MKARSARTTLPAVVAALALTTGGFAYGASVVDDGSSTAELQPDEGTPGSAPGGTATMRPQPGVAPSTSVAPGSTSGMLPGASPASEAPTGTDVDTSDGGKKGAEPTTDKGVKNAPVTTG